MPNQWGTYSPFALDHRRTMHGGLKEEAAHRERAMGVSVSPSGPEGPKTLCLVEEDVRV